MMQTVTMARSYEVIYQKKIPQNQQPLEIIGQQNSHINGLNLEILCSPTPAIVS